MLDLKTSIKPK